MEFYVTTLAKNYLKYFNSFTKLIKIKLMYQEDLHANVNFSEAVAQRVKSYPNI